MDNTKKSNLFEHKFFLISGLFISIFLVFAAVFLAGQRTSWFGRAETPNSASTFSRENSYIFASPITAAANGISLIRITVFILNNQGLGVAGETVEINTSGSLTIAQTQPVTDNFGRAIFEVTANTPQDYTISAEVSKVPLLQKVSISFR